MACVNQKNESIKCVVRIFASLYMHLYLKVIKNINLIFHYLYTCIFTCKDASSKHLQYHTSIYREIKKIQSTKIEQ